MLTLSRVQFTQDADVSITWADVCKYTEEFLVNYENENRFVLEQFIYYLKENGMVFSGPISMESLLGYWEVHKLKNRLKEIFREIASIAKEFDNDEFPDISSMSKAKFNPYYDERWGRIGVSFFESWDLGLFAGVIVNISDHKLDPMDEKKDLIL